MNTPITIPLESSTYTYQVLSDEIPLTATLKSSEAGRKIELSTDGGTEYFTPTYDATSATMLVVSVATPVSHIKVTGAVSDNLILVI